mmetsp:Transcript_2891/g.2882  ORF Transcript_2891/g.2882 Transcript_2891/m.2882 type:complete len:422 (-) Transcript_2891:286-1551(-)
MTTMRKRTNSKHKEEVKELISPSDVSDDEVKPKTNEPVVKETTLQKILVRTILGFCMVGYYLSMLRGGHMYCILTGVLTQVELFRELVNVRYRQAQEKEVPLFRTIQWIWFFLAMIYIYGESFHRFCSENKALFHVTKITQYLDVIAFASYCILFIMTVLTLKPGIMKFQLSQLMWTIATVCLVVGQCKFLANCVLNGLFWFFFPMATVVMNDVSAYFCGISFGRKFIKAPFLSLSPNKTWEGFIGGAILTFIFSFFFPALLAQFSWFTCPAQDLSFIPLSEPILHCEPNPVFILKEYTVILPFYNIPYIVSLYPVQLHGVVYGLFASFIAPFGGFMASAIKRAYGIKDFESFFPGHGGMMDRMDCQLLMLCFTWVHLNTFIIPKIPTINNMLHMISLMPINEQVELSKQLIKHLEGITNQ